MLIVRRHSYSALPSWLLTIVLLSASQLAAACATTEAQALDQYLSRMDRDSGNEATIEISIEASLSKLHKSARLRTIQYVSRMGRSVFQPLDSEGDAMVRREVIGRYLNAEVQAREAPDPKVAITTENYRFFYERETDYAGQSAYVYRLEPKHKRVGLFNGELWLDAQTGRVLREWGEFAQSPSRLVKSVYFVRDYAMERGESPSSVPRRLILNVSTRLFGRADVTIWFDRVASGSEAASAFNAGALTSPDASLSAEWTSQSTGGE